MTDRKKLVKMKQFKSFCPTHACTTTPMVGKQFGQIVSFSLTIHHTYMGTGRDIRKLVMSFIINYKVINDYF